MPKKNPKREESKCQTCQNCYANKCSFVRALFPGEILKSLEGKKYKIYRHEYTGEKRKKEYYESYKVLECPDYLEENKKNIKKAV